MIQVVFTTRSSFLSNAIRYITGEPVSHVALRCGKTVVHSSTAGVEATTWDEFSEDYKVVHQVRVKGTKQKMLDVIGEYDKAGYDYLGLAWLSTRYILKKFLGINIPKANLWQVSGMYMCTEFVTEVVEGEADSLITPYQLYKRLSK